MEGCNYFLPAVFVAATFKLSPAFFQSQLPQIATASVVTRCRGL
jgi:hypothetical protein